MHRLYHHIDIPLVLQNAWSGYFQMARIYSSHELTVNRFDEINYPFVLQPGGSLDTNYLLRWIAHPFYTYEVHQPVFVSSENKALESEISAILIKQGYDMPMWINQEKRKVSDWLIDNKPTSVVITDQNELFALEDELNACLASKQVAALLTYLKREKATSNRLLTRNIWLEEQLRNYKEFLNLSLANNRRLKVVGRISNFLSLRFPILYKHIRQFFNG